MPQHEAERYESCAVCGRTILRGERVTEFLTPDRESRQVCSLCHERAEAQGWTRADAAPAPGLREGERRRRGSKLRERARAYAERVRPRLVVERRERAEPVNRREAPKRPPTPPEPASASAPSAPKEEPSQPAQATEAEPTARARPRARAEPAKSEAKRQQTSPKPRRRRPDTPERRIGRAIARFNESDQPRVVAGLIRSLGEPQAAVEDVSARPPRVQVTVAWELSWYRWEVDLDGAEAPVREVAKGSELSELDAEPRWNASVDGEGRVRWDDGSS